MYLAMECEKCGKPRYDCVCNHKEEYHTYMREGRAAKVIRYHDDNIWGCEYYENQLVDGMQQRVFIAEEKYPNHNEHWAEDCADNYVFGIKNFEENQTQKG
jgi:hypothetical protein